MRSHEFISEIERLGKSGFEGGKDYLDSYGREKSIQPLPGGSGLLYSITNDSGDFIIKLWDKDNKDPFEPTTVGERPSYYTRQEWNRYLERAKQRDADRKRLYNRAPGKLIGQLTVNDVGSSFPLPGAVQVGTITVDEDYRGMGLAKSLYGIVLTIMRRPLLAGSSQTPGGRKNWLSLSQIPGVEMKGYFKVDDYDINTMDPKDSPPWDRGRVPRQNKAAEKRIDTIMGELGGQYIGQNRWGNHYFAFDVRPNTTKQELEAHVNTKLSQIYGGYYSSGGLYAVWTGK